MGKQITKSRVDVEIIESGKKKLRIQIYLHMCGQGIRTFTKGQRLTSWMHLVSLKAYKGMGQMYIIVNILEMCYVILN